MRIREDFPRTNQGEVEIEKSEQCKEEGGRKTNNDSECLSTERERILLSSVRVMMIPTMNKSLVMPIVIHLPCLYNANAPESEDDDVLWIQRQ
jgi:hypothetical protein